MVMLQRMELCILRTLRSFTGSGLLCSLSSADLSRRMSSLLSKLPACYQVCVRLCVCTGVCVYRCVCVCTGISLIEETNDHVIMVKDVQFFSSKIIIFTAAL